MVVFGCAHNETLEFVKQIVDGIIGLGVMESFLPNLLPPTVIDIAISN